MSLLVRTSRIGSVAADAFDVTRKSGGQAGAPFAPSWSILAPALDARKRAKVVLANAEEEIRTAKAMGSPAERIDSIRNDARERADAIEQSAWDEYVPLYLAEMRRSYREARPAWDALLGRPSVTLHCYCIDPSRCHRRILAGILVKLGAVDGGEVERLESKSTLAATQGLLDLAREMAG